MIKEGLAELVGQAFNREGSLCLACGDKGAFFASWRPGRYKLWSCRGMCGALHCLLGNIFVGFGSELCERIVGVPVGANCAPLVADLFLFSCGGGGGERGFVLSLSGSGRTGVVGAFGSASGCLGGLLGIDNLWFGRVIDWIYLTELRLNKANSSDTEAPFLDLNLSMANSIVSSKIYDKRDDFGFGIVSFPFLGGDIPRSPSYGVYISQLVRFARVCSVVDDFNGGGLFLAAKLLERGYGCRKVREVFS